MKENFTFEEQQLMSIYNPGTRLGLIHALVEMRTYDKPNCTRMELPWTKVVKYYDALMESGRFVPQEELEQRNDSEKVVDRELAAEQPELTEPEQPVVNDTPSIEPPLPVQEESEPAAWEYNEIKSAHPEDIVLYQVGDFFEIYGEDAKQAAPVLDLHLGSRPIPTGGRVDMCGIPAHQLEECTETGRFYDADLEELQQSQERLWDAAQSILTALAKL